MSRALHRLVRLGLLAIGAGLLLRHPTLSRARRRLTHQAAKRFRYLEGRLEGAEYRRLGQQPDPTVTGVLLADRVRSALGPLEKRRDLPRVHVMAEGHTVLLHGEVPTDADAEAVERAVLATSGVTAIRSFLHVGLLQSDARPSEGRRHQPPSDAYRRLVGAVGEAAAVDDATARRIARATLATLTARLPEEGRRHLSGHLPPDARALAEPRLLGWDTDHVETPLDFDVAVAAASGEWQFEPTDRAVRAVLRVLRELVPEEAADVAAVLPPSLQELWRGEAPVETVT